MKQLIGLLTFLSLSAFAESPGDLRCGTMKIPAQLLNTLNRPTCIANKVLSSTSDNKHIEQGYVSGVSDIVGGIEIRVFEGDHSSFSGSDSQSVKLIEVFSSENTTESTVPAYALRSSCGLSLFTGKILNPDEGLIFFNSNTVLKLKHSSQEIQTIYSDYKSNVGHNCAGFKPSVDAYDAKVAKLVANLNDSVLSPEGIILKDVFDASVYKKMGFQIHQMGWKNGYSCQELLTGGFNLWDLKLFKVGPQTGFDEFSFRDVKTLIEFGCPRSSFLRILPPKNTIWLYDSNESLSHGLKELKEYGYTIEELQGVMDAKGKSRPFPWKITDLKGAGYTFKETSNFKHTAPWGESWYAFSDIDMKTAGFKAKDFVANGLTLRDLRVNKTFSGEELVKEGFSCSDLKNAGYGLFQRKGCSP